MRFSIAVVLAFAGSAAFTGCGFPWVADSPRGPTIPEAMRDLMSSRDRVSVALMCTTEASLNLPLSSGTFKSSGFDVEKWKNSVCQDALGNTEQWMLARYGPHKNFSLVDRFATENLLIEMRVSTATAVSPEVRRELEKRLGATHVFFVREKVDEVEGALYRKITEIRDSRLIDVETGAVVAAESHRYVTRKLY